MTRDDIIRMARQAGLDVVKLSPALHEMQVDVWMRFAALVAAAEREACAKVCDEMADDAAKEQDFHALSAAESCAAAIRARGQE